MKVCISLSDFMRYTMGEIYALAPYHEPRYVEEIAESVIANFKKGCKQAGNDFFYHEVELKDVEMFINNTLMPIEKFQELNLSQKEFEQGISVDDDSRQEFQFVSMYSSIPEEDNFVDLDACIRNIFCRIEHYAFEEWKGSTTIEELLEFRKIYSEGEEE